MSNVRVGKSSDKGTKAASVEAQETGDEDEEEIAAPASEEQNLQIQALGGQAVDLNAGAVLIPRKAQPGYVISVKGYKLRDPETGTFLEPGQVTKLADISSWVRSQIKAGLVQECNKGGEPIDE